jgi:hypothetical protein
VLIFATSDVDIENDFVTGLNVINDGSAAPPDNLEE